jgi:hypothetical protein
MNFSGSGPKRLLSEQPARWPCFSDMSSPTLDNRFVSGAAVCSLELEPQLSLALLAPSIQVTGERVPRRDRRIEHVDDN